MPKTDIAIITVIPEEYAAVATRLEAQGCRVSHDPGARAQPNQYGWATGELADEQGQIYQLVLAAAVSPGPTHMANAVNATLARFRPRYVLLVGIAGGFALDGLTRGDVAVSSVIYDYEYGKIAAGFQPRHDNTYQVDGALLRSAVTLHARDPRWAAVDAALRPAAAGGQPKLLSGAVASGSKVVDNAEYALFASVHASWPKLLAVEMEGAGAVSTINVAVSGGRRIGFLMIRGISDMPRVGSEGADEAPAAGNTAERDTWKKYAAAVAASFTVHWIKRGWPVPPARRAARAPGSASGTDGDDDDGPPPTAVARRRDPKAVGFDPFAGGADSSTWLGFVRALAPTAEAAAELARGGPAAVRAILGLLAERREQPAPGGGSEFDTELALVKAHLDRHETEVAEVKLKELEVRAADRLKSHQWYELKALRSRIHSGRWEWERAGRELLDAKRHMPDTERARVNEALGHELVGESDKAHALATALRAEFPHSVRLLTIWVRTAPATERLDALAAAAGPYKDDEELTLALAHRAMLESRFDEAIPFARRATELDPESPHAWFVLGEATHAAGYRPGGGNPGPLLQEAAGHYGRAVQLAQKEKLPGLEAAARFNRAKVRHLLGDSRAEADFQRAVELCRPDQGVRTGYAGFLLQMGRPADALRELEAAGGEPAGERAFLEAAARYERNTGDDRERARDLLRGLIAAAGSDRWADAHTLLVQRAVEDKTQAAAREVISQSTLRDVNPLVFHTLEGWLSESAGDKEAARTAFRRALVALTPAAPRDHLFLLAQALVSVNEDALALPLLERCHRPGVFDRECKILLDAARRLDRHDVSTRVCRELREAGTSDPRLIETEIGILQMYDPEEALRVASEYLTRHPDNRRVALWQSALALRLDRPDLVISDLSRLPAVGEVTAQGSGLVLNILVETGQPAVALRYAYDALRAHFDDEFAHGQYLAYFLKLNRHCPELRAGDRADVGSAVCYREGRDEADRWAVLEDGPDPDLARDEYPPDHPLSKALAGHRVGETVTVSDTGLQPRAVTTRQAFHKFIYRFQD